MCIESDQDCDCTTSSTTAVSAASSVEANGQF